MDSEQQANPQDPSIIAERARRHIEGNLVNDSADETTDYELQQKKEILTDLQTDRALRKQYGNRIFLLVVIWLIFIAIILIFSGWQLKGFQLADSVLIALMGTTTVNVIGILVAVTSYLFPKKYSK